MAGRLPQILSLQLLRVASGGAAALAFGKVLDYATDGQSHHFLTYAAFCGAGAFFALVFAWTWVVIDRRKRGALSPLEQQAQAELVETIDDWKAQMPTLVTSPTFGPFEVLRAKTIEFVESVFGAHERQRLGVARPDRPAETLTHNLEDYVRTLEDLRDHPERWRLQVNRKGLRDAVDRRRARTAAERILEAAEPPPNEDRLPRRDDRRDLAEAFTSAAAQLDDYLTDRSSERPEIEAYNVEAMMEVKRAEGEEVSIEEIGRDAADYSDTVSKTQYLLTMGPHVGKLFDLAVEEGAIAPGMRRHFTSPESHGALEQLPDDLREIARRLREPRGR
jgi:hypothetical protein